MHEIMEALAGNQNVAAAHLHLRRNEDTNSLNLYGFVELLKYAECNASGNELLEAHSKEIKSLLKGMAAKPDNCTAIVRTHPSLASKSYGFYEFSVVERFVGEQEMRREIDALEKSGYIFQPTYKVGKIGKGSDEGHDKSIPEEREKIFFAEKKKHD